MTKRYTAAILSIACLFACGVMARSQNTSTDSTQTKQTENATATDQCFRLNFRVLEFSPEGKVIDSRSYSISIASPHNTRASIRTGDRIPVAVNSSDIQYMDVGTNIDASFEKAEDSDLQIYVSAHVSTLSTEPPAPTNHPIVRETSWSGPAIVPVGKPTIIFSSDNNADKGKAEIELTAVPIGK